MNTTQKTHETEEDKMMRVGAVADNLRDYLTGYIKHGDKAALLTQMSNWRMVARREIERRQSHLITCLDDEIVEALANGEIDFQNELEFVQDSLAIARDLDAQATRQASIKDPECPDAVVAIALSVLELPTLETRNSDALDFYSLAVWLIKAALIEAYQCGGADALAAQGGRHE